MPTLAEQWNHEQEMSDKGILRLQKNDKKKKDKKTESNTSYGKSILKRMLSPMIKEFDLFMEQQSKLKSPVIQQDSYALLQLIEGDHAIAIACRTLIDTVTRKTPATQCYNNIGSKINDEIIKKILDEENPELFARIDKDHKERSSGYMYRRRKILEAGQRASIQFKQHMWTTSEKVRVGRTLYLLIERAFSPALFQEYYLKKGKKHVTFIGATPQLLERINKIKFHTGFLLPDYEPTIIPPKPWSDVVGGGYYSKALPAMKIVKTQNANYLEELRLRNPQGVYDSLNIMQETPFVINKNILKFMNECWEKGIHIGALPSSKLPDEPIKPSQDQFKDENIKKKWKAKRVEYLSGLQKVLSKQLLAKRTLDLAFKYENKTFYFPYQLCFRGRMYAVPAFLNPQGTDTAKSLLLFKNKKPLGEKGACYLAIHGANCYGYDKCNFQDRIDFIEKHTDRIVNAVTKPFDDMWWTEADDPWQFLAFCYEWKNFIDIGESYECPLPVSLDATCSGLQHFSACIRSEVTGKEVNMLPSEIPGDIYQSVANDTIKLLKEDESEFSKLWLEYGVDRSIAKRPTMTICYGSKQYSWTDFVREIVDKRIDRGNHHPFGDKLLPACSFLAKKLWAAATHRIEAASKVMKWLQQVARVASSEGLPIVWETPMEFPVLQAYENLKPLQIETRLMGRVFKPQILVPNTKGKKYDPRKNAAGLSPNFVHALDSCHLMMTICTAEAEGIKNFSMVHDSYGSLAADAELLGVCCRSAFVNLYKHHDVLLEFRDDILQRLPESKKHLIPMPPEKGSLDIELVLDSEFFFS